MNEVNAEQMEAQFKDRQKIRKISNCLVLAAWFGAMFLTDFVFGYATLKVIDGVLALAYLAAAPFVLLPMTEKAKRGLGVLVILNLLMITSLPLFTPYFGIQLEFMLLRHVVSLLFAILLGPYFIRPQSFAFFLILFYNALCFYIPMLQSGTVQMTLAYVVIIYSFTLLFSYFFLDILRMNVTQISLLIKAHKQAEKMATKDTLTETYNRGYFDNFIKSLIEDDAEKVLLFISLDQYRQVVENHGYLVGDTYLKKTAAMLAEKIRSEDMLARYGGEEFVIVLDNSSLDLGSTVARRILSGMKTVMPDYPRASIGITKIISGITYQTAMVNADTALFRAKKSEGLAMVDPENPQVEPIHWMSRTEPEHPF
jgi:diguanylate cyclase (GGDEF)-like protein